MTYLLEQLKNVSLPPSIYDLEDLIHFVEKENRRIQEEKSQGSVTISKFDSKGELIIKKEITLPFSDYPESVLEDFEATKPLPKKQSLWSRLFRKKDTRMEEKHWEVDAEELGLEIEEVSPETEQPTSAVEPEDVEKERIAAMFGKGKSAEVSSDKDMTVEEVTLSEPDHSSKVAEVSRKSEKNEQGDLKQFFSDFTKQKEEERHREAHSSHAHVLPETSVAASYPESPSTVIVEKMPDIETVVKQRLRDRMRENDEWILSAEDEIKKLQQLILEKRKEKEEISIAYMEFDKVGKYLN